MYVRVYNIIVVITYFMVKWMESSCLLVWLAREAVRCAFLRVKDELKKVCVQGILCVFVMSANLQHICIKTPIYRIYWLQMEWWKAENVFYRVQKRVLSIERLSNIIDCVIIPFHRIAPSRGWIGKSLKGCFSKRNPCIFHCTQKTHWHFVTRVHEVGVDLATRQ